MSFRYRMLVVFVFLLFTLSVFTIDGLSADPVIQNPIVRAVLFYSPSCGHCHIVIGEDLPPLIDKYGEQLQIMGINVATQEGIDLYENFLLSWKIDESRYGVPALVVGDFHLLGAEEIPQQFPGIIENGIQTGGIDWPDIPGMLEIVAQVSQSEEENVGDGEEPTVTSSDPQEEIEPQETVVTQDNQTGGVQDPEQENVIVTEALSVPFDHKFTVWDRFQQDLAGNILAVTVLAGMLVSVIWVLSSVLRSIITTGKDCSWIIPILSVLGLVVAGYLSFVEVTETEAVCGPIGNCNTVQQSPYARLFGFLPIGILGLLGYIGITFAWVMKEYGPESWRGKFTLMMWGMTLFGVVFSIYLTYLEPFVIGATCAWCVSSAVIITLQFWAATEPVRQIWIDLDDDLEE